MRFSQLNYSTAEDNGPLQSAVILSDVLSTSITVQIKDINNTAIGECTKPYHQDIANYGSVIYMHIIFTQ